MMKRIAMRMMSEGAAAVRGRRGALAVIGAVIAVSVIAAGIIVGSFGGSAAAADNVPQVGPEVTTPAQLAGRWSGQYYGYGRQGDTGKCPDGGCGLTYDIVACKDGWCGIAVTDNKTCGSVGVRLAADAKEEADVAFKGTLELAKGSAPYNVEAWYRNDDSKPTLHFLGDTGELILMRRSFPFEANLERTGDAVCKLDKATS